MKIKHWVGWVVVGILATELLTRLKYQPRKSRDTKKEDSGSTVLKMTPKRMSDAVSAVTGGSPEDINEMPPTENPEQEGPIYDGSDLELRSVR